MVKKISTLVLVGLMLMAINIGTVMAEYEWRSNVSVVQIMFPAIESSGITCQVNGFGADNSGDAEPAFVVVVIDSSGMWGMLIKKSVNNWEEIFLLANSAYLSAGKLEIAFDNTYTPDPLCHATTGTGSIPLIDLSDPAMNLMIGNMFIGP